MNIQEQIFDELKPALECLEEMSKNRRTVFRGHRNASWRLSNSLSRHENIPISSALAIQHHVEQFRSSLAKLGKQPLDTDKIGDWLEFAQHHGLPTPLIDFTYSPYIALFFAFNGVKQKIETGDDQYAAIYVLDTVQLGDSWMTLSGRNEHQYLFAGEFWAAAGDLNKYDMYPFGELLFIPIPSGSNPRMMRQQGAFIYDTLPYFTENMRCLEDFIAKQLKSNRPIVTKVLINKNCVSEVFSRLELMGITGTYLFLDSAGAAMDTINSYAYEPRTPFIRDARFNYNQPK